MAVTGDTSSMIRTRRMCMWFNHTITLVVFEYLRYSTISDAITCYKIEGSHQLAQVT